MVPGTDSQVSEIRGASTASGFPLSRGLSAEAGAIRLERRPRRALAVELVEKGLHRHQAGDRHPFGRRGDEAARYLVADLFQAGEDGVHVPRGAGDREAAGDAGSAEEVERVGVVEGDRFRAVAGLLVEHVADYRRLHRRELRHREAGAAQQRLGELGRADGMVDALLRERGIAPASWRKAAANSTSS